MCVYNLDSSAVFVLQSWCIISSYKVLYNLLCLPWQCEAYMWLSNKLIITAKSQASNSNYKIAQASKKFQIPNPFSLPLLREKEITVTILTFMYTMDQISSSMLMNYWTRDYINRKHLCTLTLRGCFSGSLGIMIFMRSWVQNLLSVS